MGVGLALSRQRPQGHWEGGWLQLTHESTAGSPSRSLFCLLSLMLMKRPGVWPSGGSGGESEEMPERLSAHPFFSNAKSQRQFKLLLTSNGMPRTLRFVLVVTSPFPPGRVSLIHTPLRVHHILPTEEPLISDTDKLPGVLAVRRAQRRFLKTKVTTFSLGLTETRRQNVRVASQNKISREWWRPARLPRERSGLS